MFELKKERALAFALASAALAFGTVAQAQYHQHNLVSDLTGLADHVDTNLKNPWGMAFSSTSPIWVANNGTGTSTLYDGNGVAAPLIVSTVPAGAPTGIVFNGSSDFNVTSNGTGPAKFIFDSENGILTGWNPSITGTNSAVGVDMSPFGAEYKGLASGNNGTTNLLFGTNFARGTIDRFGPNFNYLGSFTDSTVDDGFAPFNVENIGGDLYVTYAFRGPTGDDVAGPGNGFVDEFDINGNLIRRFASHGVLNSPWGLAKAPANFGAFSNDLLVGNFGDGTINAFDPGTGAFVGTLKDEFGNQISVDGLWALKFGNGAQNTSKNSLFFTAGINDEADGLFGRFDPVPEPASFLALGLGILPLLRLRRKSR